MVLLHAARRLDPKHYPVRQVSVGQTAVGIAQRRREAHHRDAGNHRAENHQRDVGNSGCPSGGPSGRDSAVRNHRHSHQQIDDPDTDPDATQTPWSSAAEAAAGVAPTRRIPGAAESQHPPAHAAADTPRSWLNPVAAAQGSTEFQPSSPCFSQPSSVLR